MISEKGRAAGGNRLAPPSKDSLACLPGANLQADDSIVLTKWRNGGGFDPNRATLNCGVKENLVEACSA